MSDRTPLDEQSAEVWRLECELAIAKSRLAATKLSAGSNPANDIGTYDESPLPAHALLLLTDSALPLGSFAFSSGLESYLAHHGYRSYSAAGSWPSSRRLSVFLPFLRLSLYSLAVSALPFVLAAWRNPERLPELDDTFDAATPCAVARRASLAQGRALVGVWERCLKGAAAKGATAPGAVEEGGNGNARGCAEDGAAKALADQALADQALALKPNHYSSSSLSSPSFLSSASTATGPHYHSSSAVAPDTDPASTHGHYPPLFGVLARSQSLSLKTAGYVFLLNHAKAVVGAAVRLGVYGPYKNWEILASAELREMLEAALKEGEKITAVEDAAQAAPLLDVWAGRHEVLYSRIFNS